MTSMSKQGAPAPRPDPRNPYVLYLGRIEPSKGCADLLKIHRAAERTSMAVPRLVMAGRVAMDLPETPWLDVRGFVTEEDFEAGCEGGGGDFLVGVFRPFARHLHQHLAERVGRLLDGRGPGHGHPRASPGTDLIDVSKCWVYQAKLAP